MSDEVLQYTPGDMAEYAPEMMTPKLRRSSQLVMPPRPSWIGTGWLPRQEITVVVGEEGIGKSLTWVLIAAHVTSGREFKPFGIPARDPQDVIVIVTEDSALEVTTRLEVAGADLDRVHFFSIDQDGSGSPDFGNSIHYENFAHLTAQIESMESRPALVVVDAWLDTVHGSMNIRDTQQARAALHPWKQLSAKYDLSTVLVTHTNRQDTTSTRDLMGGTAALRQKARMVLFCARPTVLETDRQELYIGPDKSNTTGLVNAVRFHVTPHQVREATDDDPGTSAKLTDPAQATGTIRELLGQWKNLERQADRQPTKAESAEAEIRDFMTGREQVETSQVKEHLRGLEYGQRGIAVALAKIGTSTPSGQGGKWLYTLNDDPSVCSVGSLGSVGTYADGVQTLEFESSPQSLQSTSTTANTANTAQTANTEDPHCIKCSRPIRAQYVETYGEQIHPGCKEAQAS
ncbi:MAG: AAA family ATPase [Brevibacterium aurantiacum]|uniref:AAA family ATPase n=1 Tax=Brevibacterium aurantiacum TaxID=273384 RepID=UPI003F918684